VGTFRELLDQDMVDTFLNVTRAEFVDVISRSQLDGTITASIPASFELFVGAVDEKERSLFRVADDISWQRADYVLFTSSITGLVERWVVVNIRRDELGMIELRCDKPEITG